MRRTGRALTLLDSMILIAAVAIGLGVYVAAGRGPFSTWFFEANYREIGRWSSWTWMAMLSRWVAWLIPVAASWTVVLPILRARSPRPP